MPYIRGSSPLWTRKLSRCLASHSYKEMVTPNFYMYLERYSFDKVTISSEISVARYVQDYDLRLIA